jgi:predicted SAM-dependent methyltransferase
MSSLKAKFGAGVIARLFVERRTFDIFRREFTALRTSCANALDPRHHAELARLAKERRLSVNLGSGGRGLPGWVNVELTRHHDTDLCLDIRRKLPFASGSVRRILLEHVLEHVDFKSSTPRLLAELHRVLEPGGVARVIVPDAERFLAAYASKDPEVWRALGWDVADLPSDIRTPMHVVNHIFHQDGEHMFGYDFETLRLLLADAGFVEIEKRAHRDSSDPELAIDQSNHAPYSLYVEARKSNESRGA